MSVQLTGFGFRGFRSFHGSEIEFLSPLSKVTLIAGQNNSGKSNVLRVAMNLKSMFVKPIEGLDEPRNPSVERFAIAIRMGDLDSVTETFCESNGRESSKQYVHRILSAPAFKLKDDGGVWVWSSHLLPTDNHVSNRAQADILKFENVALAHYYQSMNFVGMNNALDMAVQFMDVLAKTIHFPTVRMVSASRRVTDGEAESQGGRNLIERLALLQNPDLDNYADTAKFKAINDFLRTVIDDRTAALRINHNATELIVERRNVALPLDYLGTGVAQVVMLAAAATLETNTVVCMEEPEVHLHPLLQRKLLQYLHSATDNQYIIATHSAHLLDSSIATVFHATYTDTGSELKFAGTPYELSSVCDDLGYRPSDLLQTNCAVWVEGPSDRIYVRHWLWIANPRLREGIDYTIMFYGGRLLNHLTPDDPDVEDFISLRRLNRHLAVIIDSDKRYPQSKINMTKKRIVETMHDPGLVWVTRGRNIENYVPIELLNNVMAQVFAAPLESNENQWSDALKPQKKDVKGPDKVRVAKEVVARWGSGLNYLDLHPKIVELARLIEIANGVQHHDAHALPKAEPCFSEP